MVVVAKLVVAEGCRDTEVDVPFPGTEQAQHRLAIAVAASSSVLAHCEGLQHLGFRKEHWWQAAFQDIQAVYQERALEFQDNLKKKGITINTLDLFTEA